MTGLAIVGLPLLIEGPAFDLISSENITLSESILSKIGSLISEMVDPDLLFLGLA